MWCLRFVLLYVVVMSVGLATYPRVPSFVVFEEDDAESNLVKPAAPAEPAAFGSLRSREFIFTGRQFKL